jgi:hypothetical protein
MGLDEESCVEEVVGLTDPTAKYDGTNPPSLTPSAVQNLLNLNRLPDSVI